MKLSAFMLSHARGQGKTHELAQFVKKIGGTLVVRSQSEANRITKEYGINTIPYDIDPAQLSGRHMGITYMDPDAIGLALSELENLIKLKDAEIKKLKDTYD